MTERPILVLGATGGQRGAVAAAGGRRWCGQWLASPDAGFSTGISWNVDGGFAA